MELKRDLVKYVRDKAKSKYNKGTECFICGATENLDFHHFHGLTELLEIWLRKNKIKITDAEDIISIREQFITEHNTELELHEDTTQRRSFIFGKKRAIALFLSQRLASDALPFSKLQKKLSKNQTRSHQLIFYELRIYYP